MHWKYQIFLKSWRNSHVYGIFPLQTQRSIDAGFFLTQNCIYDSSGGHLLADYTNSRYLKSLQIIR